MCNTAFETASDAAAGMQARGAKRVLVTDGGNAACEATDGDIISSHPPDVLVTRVTGAGDTFMAAHIAAETRGANRAEALEAALDAAARYVSGETP